MINLSQKQTNNLLIAAAIGGLIYVLFRETDILDFLKK